jgi:hypothetical protein
VSISDYSLGMDREYQVLGLIEIAELLDVDKRTPHAWFYRGLMPDPDHEAINGSRAWDRATIVRWAAKTGRLPVSLAQEGVDLVGYCEVERGGRAAKAMIQEEKRSAT